MFDKLKFTCKDQSKQVTTEEDHSFEVKTFLSSIFCTYFSSFCLN